MYMGEPQSVAAIMLFWRYLAKPKSAEKTSKVLMSVVEKQCIMGNPKPLKSMACYMDLDKRTGCIFRIYLRVNNANVIKSWAVSGEGKKQIFADVFYYLIKRAHGEFPLAVTCRNWKEITQYSNCTERAELENNIFSDFSLD